MNNYELLKEYLDSSVLISYDKYLKLRMSKDLKEKYNSGSYNVFLNILNNCFNSIKKLNIDYGKQIDTLYIYVVPDENCTDILNTPNNFKGKNSSFKPVPCFDDDSFKSALGISQNIMESKDFNKIGISTVVGITHEISHLIGTEFYKPYALFSEGFAETMSLYIMGYEDLFDEHREMLGNLESDDILTPREIINSINDRSFGKESLINNNSCSFRKSYVSSYLFVRGCIETIETNFGINKIEALQKYLNIIKDCCNDNYHVEDVIKSLAKKIGIDENNILDNKEMQLNIIDNYKTKRLR